MTTSDLSDGLRSLFSLSLASGLFQVEGRVASAPAKHGFKAKVVDDLPILTVFAVEEPENHLSPHYLGRVVSGLCALAEHQQGQVLLSSHSPCILSRVKPDHVRYFLGHEHTRSTQVKPVPLPADDSDEAYKYVREAVRGYPELYFSRLVILVEGPSEGIVLRRLFEVNGTPLDTCFITVTPLGGRHVNHFWRLLHGLEIPFLTLLDLDREKEGAGWERVQYVRDQLVDRYAVGDGELRITSGIYKGRSLDEKEWGSLKHRDDTETGAMGAWLHLFEAQFGVFFSAPLDLDLSMLEAFPDTYKDLDAPFRGPQIPTSDDPKYWDAVLKRMRQVLAADAEAAPARLGSTYTDKQKELFPWYKYLFADGSKPVAHMRALLSIDDTVLKTTAPEVLRRLVERARKVLPKVP